MLFQPFPHDMCLVIVSTRIVSGYKDFRRNFLLVQFQTLFQPLSEHMRRRSIRAYQRSKNKYAVKFLSTNAADIRNDTIIGRHSDIYVNPTYSE